jgi:2-dehydro-3-deoxyphosphogluconate aldolase/(4S)-4-hydroxy-2-oxoglutarate aldolase
MQKFTDAEIFEKVESTGLIPVFNHNNPEVSKQVLKASYEAGLRLFEFTNRGQNAFEVFKELAAYASRFEGLILGIGTIFTKADAIKFHDLGARFVVSPALVPEMAVINNMDEVLWVPGCGTVSEVYKAHSLGAKLIKIFPGNVLGHEFVKSVKDVMPSVSLMPTGGVSPNRENLAAWFGSGVSCVGMGSQLIPKDLLAAGDYVGLKAHIQKAFTLVQSVRKPKA